PTISHASVQGNTASLGGAMATYYCYPILTNCVFWNNGGSNTFYDCIGDSPTSTYTLFDANVTGDATNGAGNLTTITSPFVSSTSVVLIPCSPAINSGNNAA